MASARKLYTDFHHEAPRERYQRKLDWPDRPVVVGMATNIVYRSDKWGDGIHDYTHPIDCVAEVICDASAGVLGHHLAGRSTRLAGPRTGSRTGDAIELTFRDASGRKRTVGFDAGPRLYDSPEVIAFDVGDMHYYAWGSRPGDGAKAIIVRSRDLVITPGGLDG